MSTPTNLYMNWANVQAAYTPPGGVLTTLALAEILDVELDVKSKQEMFFGDNRKTPRLIKNVEHARSISIHGGNCASLLQIPEDIPCTISATLLDPVNGLGTGAITIVMANCVRESTGIKSPNNKFGTGSVKFNAFGNADDSDALTVTVAT